MSGVDVAAGLALAVLPLIISAAEHYDDCLRPFLRYKRIVKEADCFRQLLKIQKTIFRNHCKKLLQELADQDVASRLLNGAGHPLCSNKHIEERLVHLLGDSREGCVTIMQMIEEQLREVQAESQKLWSIIESERQNITKTTFDKGLKHRIAEKLRFSFSKPRLDQILVTLRALNGDFKTLCAQILQLPSRQARARSITPHDAKCLVEKYQTVGRASQQVYEALGRACTKHTEHQAHFCLNVDQAIVNGKQALHIKFQLAFTHSALSDSASHNDPIWLVVDSATGDTTMEDTSIVNLDALTRSLKRQLDVPIHEDGPSKVKKCVRFQTPVAAPDLYSQPKMIANAFSPDSRMRRDFCDYLKSCFCQPVTSDTCVGVLENTDDFRHLLYPSTSPTQGIARESISLGQMISAARSKGMAHLPLYERMRLSKTLAVAVLQHHATPWLGKSWRRDDIFFFGVDEWTSHPNLELMPPHLNVKVKGPHGQISRASTFPQHRMARNPLLFSLGVLLLEIAYSSPLESFQGPCDLQDGVENRYTEFFLARRLAKSGCSGMGIKYDKIIERLVECDFGCGDDLNNVQLQAALHNEVVFPLEQLDQKLRDLHFEP